MLRELQKMVGTWARKNFGPHVGPENIQGYRCLLGAIEELGELCHAHLKQEQGIRGTPDIQDEQARDALGDIVIYLCDYCEARRFDFEDCVRAAWSKVKERDWRRFPNNGKTT